MPTTTEVILKAVPGKNARISQYIEERMPHRWYRKALAGLQVPVIVVCRFEECCVSLTHAFVGVAANDTSAAAEIKACSTIAKCEQGRRSLRVTGFHQNAPCRSAGGRCGNADLRPLDGEGLVSQTPVRFATAPISANRRGI